MHLQVLADARVVALQSEGWNVLVSLEPECLDQAKLLIAEFERHWDARLDALLRVVE